MGNTRAAYSDKIQGFRLDPTVRTVNTVPVETNAGTVLPEHQVPQFLASMVVSSGYMAAAATTDVSGTCPFQVQPYQAGSIYISCLFHSAYSIPLNSQQRCDISFLHLVQPPCLHKEYTAPDVLFSSFFFNYFNPYFRAMSRIYKICKDCKKKTEIYGFGEITKDVEVYIV